MTRATFSIKKLHHKGSADMRSNLSSKAVISL
jgi:hypothetical protein